MTKRLNSAVLSLISDLLQVSGIQLVQSFGSYLITFRSSTFYVIKCFISI